MSGAKGLDDLVFAGGRPRIRMHHRLPEGFNTRRAPYGLPDRTPVRGGTSLAEARATTKAAVDGFIAGRDQNVGKALLISSDPGVGKTTAVAHAVSREGLPARITVGTKALARELATTHGYHYFEGRNADNCERIDVVTALAEAGHSIGPIACGDAALPRCPFRAGCRYFAQAEEPGTRVGTTEQLFNPVFLNGGELVVIDDADLRRALIESRRLSASSLASTAELLRTQARDAELLVAAILRHALIGQPPQGGIGPSLWDHLAATATRQGHSLPAAIEAVGELASGPPGGWSVPVAIRHIEAAAPEAFNALLRALQEELPLFTSGEDFNCRLRLRAGAYEVAAVRKPVLGKNRKPIVATMPMLVLDATPVPSLVEALTRGLELLPLVQARTNLPESVYVTQYAVSANGYAAMAEGASGALSEEVARERRLFPVDDAQHEAAIVYRSVRADFKSLGFEDDQILSFGSARGTNRLAEVTRLHVVGRPMPPTDNLHYLAQVLHHGGLIVSDEIVLRQAAYEGQAYGIQVVDFADDRMAELLKGEREDELHQVIQRARLADTSTRPEVRLAVHTSHPIPGLRVDELVLPPSDGPALNRRRAADAEGRVKSALDRLRQRSGRVTVDAVARESGTQWRTAKKVLTNIGDDSADPLQNLSTENLVRNRPTAAGPELDFGTPLQTLGDLPGQLVVENLWDDSADPIKRSIWGMQTRPQIPGPLSTNAAAGAPPRDCPLSGGPPGVEPLRVVERFPCACDGCAYCRGVARGAHALIDLSRRLRDVGICVPCLAHMEVAS